MNRIEDIKHRLAEWKRLSSEESYEAITDKATADIEHLLNVLEIAQKALEKINDYCGYLTGEVAKEIRDVADTAPDKIHEEEQK